LLKGKSLLEKGKTEQALAQLRTATSLLPANAVAFSYLGLALHESGQSAEAERAYYRALTLNHELAEARYNLGCLFLAENKVEQAKSELTAFTLRRPGSPEGWTKLGTAQLRSREPVAAERSFNQALRLKPQDPECLTGIGLARVQRNRSAEAVECFRSALRRQPDYAPALLNLAIVAQENLKDTTLALQQYRLYLALKPAPENSAAVQKVVHELELERTQPAAIPAAQPPTLAQQSRGGGAGKVAVSEFPASASAAQPSNAAPKAAPIGEKPTSINKTHSSVEVAKAAVPTNEPKLQTATNPPKTAEAAPQQPKPVQPRAATPATPLEVVGVADDQVFKVAQDIPPSADSSSAAKVSVPGTSATQQPNPYTPPKSPKRGLLSKINPARLFSSSGDKPIPAAPPQSTPSRSGDTKTETSGLAKQTEPPATPAARYKYLSPAQPKPGDRTEAERAYSQGVRAAKAQRLMQALEAYRRATELDPAYFDAQYNLGVVTAAAGDLQAALVAYEHALAIHPDSLDARYNFALSLQQANFPVDALNEFEKLLASYPDESRAHLAVGNLYAQQFRQPAKAREHYLKVLATDPKNSQASAIRYWLTENPPR